MARDRRRRRQRARDMQELEQALPPSHTPSLPISDCWSHLSPCVPGRRRRIIGVAYGGDDFLTDMGVQGASDQVRPSALNRSAIPLSAWCVRAIRAPVASSPTHEARSLLPPAPPTFFLSKPKYPPPSSPVVAEAVALCSRPVGRWWFDGVQYVNFRSAEGLRAQATDVKRLGYRGMFAIHPNQVQTINECFSPSAQEIDYAKKVVAAYEEAERYAGLVRMRCSARSHTCPSSTRLQAGQGLHVSRRQDGGRACGEESLRAPQDLAPALARDHLSGTTSLESYKRRCIRTPLQILRWPIPRAVYLRVFFS
jgi:hypothetical protein